MQKITSFLWFNDKAEEAANFYVSIFNNSKIDNISRYGDAGPGPAGTPMVVEFTLEGQEFMALNGGPAETNPGGPYPGAIALYVDCETQAEVDRLQALLRLREQQLFGRKTEAAAATEPTAPQATPAEPPPRPCAGREGR